MFNSKIPEEVLLLGLPVQILDTNINYQSLGHLSYCFKDSIRNQWVFGTLGHPPAQETGILPDRCRMAVNTYAVPTTIMEILV